MKALLLHLYDLFLTINRTTGVNVVLISINARQAKLEADLKQLGDYLK